MRYFYCLTVFCLLHCLVHYSGSNDVDYAHYVNNVGKTIDGNCFCETSSSSLNCVCEMNGIQYVTDAPEAALLREYQLYRRYPGKWPSRIYDARKWHPLLGVLTGNEEPLFHMRMFPFDVPKIDTKFYLFDRIDLRHKPLPVSYRNNIWDKVPEYDALYIVVHGWRDITEEEHLIRLKNNLLEYTQQTDPGVLLVDWRRGASAGFDLSKCLKERLFNCVYKPSAANAVIVGREVGLIVYTMVKLLKIQEQGVHLIGCGLGAQVSHFASQWFTQLFANEGKNRHLGRLTALDPVARDFEGYLGAHVNESDALFVDVIHTSAVYEDGSLVDLLNGRHGMSSAVGYIDFYPNGGHSQPGCPLISSASCIQRKAVEYFADSLEATPKSDLISVPCREWAEYRECKALRVPQNLRSLSKMGIDAEHYCGSKSHYLAYPAPETRYQRDIKATALMDSFIFSKNDTKVLKKRSSTSQRLDCVSNIAEENGSSRDTQYLGRFEDEDTVDPRDHPFCGLFAKKDESRIMYGLRAYNGQFPWFVQIFRRSFYNPKKWFFICGGSIIDDLWILTAAHCFVPFELEGKQMRIFYGSASEYASMNRKQVTMTINFKKHFGPHHGANVFVHEAYEDCTCHNDVALVWLPDDDPVEGLPTDSYEGGNANRICLHPKEHFTYDACRPRTVQVAGFGVTDNRNISSKYLLYHRARLAPVWVYPIHTARSLRFRNLDDAKQVVYVNDYPAKAHSCEGDSGGASVFYQNLKKSPNEAVAPQRAYQVGIVGFGNPTPCIDAPVVVKVHTRVGAYVDWIRKTMATTYY